MDERGVFVRVDYLFLVPGVHFVSFVVMDVVVSVYAKDEDSQDICTYRVFRARDFLVAEIV